MPKVLIDWIKANNWNLIMFRLREKFAKSSLLDYF